MRKQLMILAVFVAALAAIPAASAGGSSHFISHATTSSLDGSTLVCNFKEAGLSAGSVETITCSATATTTYECVNGGGKNPSASNKTTTVSAASGSGTFAADKNGNLQGSQRTPVPSAASLGFSCPSGQTTTFVSVVYTNVLVTDTTSGISRSLADQSYTNPNAP